MRKMHELGCTKLKGGAMLVWSEERPPCIVTEINKPNLKLMAQANSNLYYQTKKDKF